MIGRRSRANRSAAAVGPRRLAAVLALLVVLIAATPASAQDSGSPAWTPEEELAQRYAPIAYLKEQDGPCDTSGEPYLPAPVDIVFDDEAVVLRQAPDREELERTIGATDLFARDDSHYVDLPGHPRTPGCGYEEHFKRRMGDQPPVVYAHVTTEEGKTGVALQYWFFYYFNDFNDKHEGDWEMIQLLFDVDTVEEALQREPDRLAYAQHKGGETVDWGDAKLDKEDGRPVVYVASGSHASFYGPAVWLGWGKDGAGLGCDITTGPSVRITPEVRLVPDDLTDPNHPFAWATFEGRWGERDTWVYNGPNGPNLNPRWTEPVSWHEGVLAGAIPLQSANALGPTPTDIFCGLIEQGSAIFTLAKPYPWAVGGALLALALVGVWLIVLAWPIVRAALSVYLPHLRTFATIGAVLIPPTVLIFGFHYLLNTDERVGRALGVTEDSAIVQTGMSLALSVVRLGLLLLVTPAVIQAVADIVAGQQPSFRRSYRVAFSKLWKLIVVALLAYVIPVLLAVTLVGIPIAIFLAVRWTFGAQAVVLDGASGRRALSLSSRTVKGHWRRTLATLAVLLFVGAVLGPIVGIALLVLAKAPPDLANAIGSIFYVFTHPFAVVGATLLYQQLKRAPQGDVAPAVAAQPRPAVAGTG